LLCFAYYCQTNKLDFKLLSFAATARCQNFGNVAGKTKTNGCPCNPCVLEDLAKKEFPHRRDKNGKVIAVLINEKWHSEKSQTILDLIIVTCC
jgi:hypothetical protein